MARSQYDELEQYRSKLAGCVWQGTLKVHIKADHHPLITAPRPLLGKFNLDPTKTFRPHFIPHLEGVRRKLLVLEQIPVYGTRPVRDAVSFAAFKEGQRYGELEIQRGNLLFEYITKEQRIRQCTLNELGEERGRMLYKFVIDISGFRMLPMPYKECDFDDDDDNYDPGDDDLPPESTFSLRCTKLDGKTQIIRNVVKIEPCE